MLSPDARICWSRCMQLPMTLAALLTVLLLLPGQALAANLPMIPTRFHLCSNEAEGLQGAARHSELSQCLTRRYHAEKLIRKACRTQVRSMQPPPKNSDARYLAERQCYIDNLSASYKTLPTPPPRPVAAPAAPKVPMNEAATPPIEGGDTHSTDVPLDAPANPVPLPPVAPADPAVSP